MSIQRIVGPLLLSIVVACGNSNRAEEERALLTQADSLLAAGDFQGALTIYESGVGYSDSQNVTRARMGVARVREIVREFDVALDLLRKLSVELSSRPSEDADRAFESILAKARGQKRYAELETEAKKLREQARANLKACREAEVAKVLDWSDHFAINRALLELSQIEARRPSTETADLQPLQKRIIDSADQHAANKLAAVPVDDREAVRMLDSALDDIAGTPTASFLVVERMKRKMSLYSKKSNGPGVTGTEGR